MAVLFSWAAGMTWSNSYSELIRNYNKRYYEICVFRSLFVGGSHEIKITFRSCLLITWWKPSCHIKGTTYSDDRFIVFTSHKLPLFRLTAKFEVEDVKSTKRRIFMIIFKSINIFSIFFLSVVFAFEGILSPEKVKYADMNLKIRTRYILEYYMILSFKYHTIFFWVSVSGCKDSTKYLLPLFFPPVFGRL